MKQLYKSKCCLIIDAKQIVFVLTYQMCSKLILDIFYISKHTFFLINSKQTFKPIQYFSSFKITYKLIYKILNVESYVHI